MRSASFSSSAARSFGTVAAQPAKRFRGGLHRGVDLLLATPRPPARCTLPVAGSSTSSSFALAGDELAVDQQLRMHAPRSEHVLRQCRIHSSGLV